MLHTRLHRPYQPTPDVPDEVEPGALPVEPDQGPVPAVIPDDPEHDRVVDPEARELERLSFMPAHHAKTHPLVVANARHSPGYDCALRLDRPRSDALLVHA